MRFGAYFIKYVKKGDKDLQKSGKFTIFAPEYCALRTVPSNLSSHETYDVFT